MGYYVSCTVSGGVMQTARVVMPVTNHDDGVPSESVVQRSALSPREYEVRVVSRSDIGDFMEKWHYSHNINGLSCRYCFGLYWRGSLIGAMIYGRMPMCNQWRRYADEGVLRAFDSGVLSSHEAESTVIELRALMTPFAIRNRISLGGLCGG